MWWHGIFSAYTSISESEDHSDKVPRRPPTETTHSRVTALDTPTKRIRNALTYAFHTLQKAEAATFRLF